MNVRASWFPATCARVGLIVLSLALVAPVAAQAAIAVTVTWEPSADPATAGYYVYSGVQSGNYTSSINVGNTTSAVIYLPDPTDPALTYYFAVQAYSAAGERGQLSSEIVFRPSQAPTLRNPGNMTSVLGVSVVVQLSATDPRNLPLIYSAGGLPRGLSISSNSGRISGIPTTAGSYDVTVAATNTDGVSGTQLFTWTISGSAVGGGTSGGGGSSPLPGSGGSPAGGNPGGGGGSTIGTPPPSGGGTPGNGVVSPPVGGGNPGSGTTPANGSGGVPTGDITAPTVRITSPATDGTYRTTNAKIIVTGLAWDDVGVLAVIWSNSRGGAGTSLATSTAAWATSPIDLKMGLNTITITATDAAGNVQTVTFDVTRYVDLENHLN